MPRVLSRNKRNPSKRRKSRLRCQAILETSKWALSSKPLAKCWRLICDTGEESSDLNPTQLSTRVRLECLAVKGVVLCGWTLDRRR